MAFAGTMGVALGSRYTRAFLRRFVDDRSAVAIVAVVDGSVQGYVLGAAVSAASTTSRKVAPAALLGLMSRPWLLARRSVRAEMLRRMSTLGKATSGSDRPTEIELPEPIFSLVAIGVAPVTRGTGLGKALVTAFEDEAARRGAASVRLSVYRDNDVACRLYHSVGWQPFPHPSNRDVLYYGRSLASPTTGAASPA
jgi:ribosomal protein S18 acetylase RimI-like enzyme